MPRCVCICIFKRITHVSLRIINSQLLIIYENVSDVSYQQITDLLDTAPFTILHPMEKKAYQDQDITQNHDAF